MLNNKEFALISVSVWRSTEYSYLTVSGTIFKTTFWVRYVRVQVLSTDNWALSTEYWARVGRARVMYFMLNHRGYNTIFPYCDKGVGKISIIYVDS